VSAEATLVQKPLLPRWLVPILLVAGAAFALWLKTKVDNAGDVALLAVAAAVVAVVVAFLRKRRRKPKPPQ
jgi:membrane protein DedA with SNARE-associated domain